MNFFDELLLKLGIEKEEATLGHKITIINKYGVVIEGHKGIASYTLNIIEVRIKGDLINIHGQNMKIVELSKDQLYIKGKIDRVQYGQS